MVDADTAIILSKFGIDPISVPAGQVRLLNSDQMIQIAAQAKDKELLGWVRDPRNNIALAYSIDSEFKSSVGMVLRNLHSGKDRAHYTVSTGEGPFWHNFKYALPEIYESGISVLVEGPKDCRYLVSNEIYQAVGYLGPAPGEGHLRVIKRYCDVIMWIPDRDPVSDQLIDRKRKVHQQAETLGIPLFEFEIPTKDPALLSERPDWIVKIKDRIEQLRSLYVKKT